MELRYLLAFRTIWWLFKDWTNNRCWKWFLIRIRPRWFCNQILANKLCKVSILKFNRNFSDKSVTKCWIRILLLFYNFLLCNFTEVHWNTLCKCFPLYLFVLSVSFRDKFSFFSLNCISGCLISFSFLFLFFNLSQLQSFNLIFVNFL